MKILGIHQNKSRDLENRIMFEQSILEDSLDVSNVNLNRPNALSRFYLGHAKGCLKLVAVAAILQQKSIINEFTKLAIKLGRLGIAEQAPIYPHYLFDILLFELFVENKFDAIAIAKVSSTAENWLAEGEESNVYGCLYQIINSPNNIEIWLERLHKKCAKKRPLLLPSTYDAVLAVHKRDKQALTEAVDSLLLEHHRSANHSRSSIYNTPASFICAVATIIVKVAHLFCNIDVLPLLKNDKNVLNLNISSLTEGDSIDRKTKYDVPVDYLYFARRENIAQIPT